MLLQTHQLPYKQVLKRDLPGSIYIIFMPSQQNQGQDNRNYRKNS